MMSEQYPTPAEARQHLQLGVALGFGAMALSFALAPETYPVFKEFIAREMGDNSSAPDPEAMEAAMSLLTMVGARALFGATS